MRFKVVVFIFVLFFSFISFAETAEDKGLRLATEAYTKNKGFVSQLSTSELILINAYGSEMNRKMSSTSIETKNDGDKVIIEFLWPADVKGTKLLTWSHKTRDDDQWLFLPALNRVKRILSTSKSGSFMGSEFSYEDVGSDEIEKYTYKFIQDDTVNERPVWVYERYPTNEKSGYSKQIVYMDKEYLQPQKIEYFDRKKELLKISNFTNFKLYYLEDKSKSFWFFHEIVVKNIQTKKSSILKWEDRKIGNKVSSTLFLKDNLLN